MVVLSVFVERFMQAAAVVIVKLVILLCCLLNWQTQTVILYPNIVLAAPFVFPWVVARYTLLLLLLRFKSASSMYLSSWTNIADSYSIELIVRWSTLVGSSHKYSSLIWSQDVFFQSWIIGALSQIVMIVCGPGLRALFSNAVPRSPFSLR